MAHSTTTSPWKKYKRYSDNVKIEARLVIDASAQLSGKFMEVRESKGDEIKCPGCGHVLSQTGGKNMPNFRLAPEIFHSRYKPLDPN